jgi:phosphoribosylformimino-5-aminoimidazole carboxamide ribonucleotide (ProFAR) isomerase
MIINSVKTLLDEENYQKEYPFSIGVPTGNKDARIWAKRLGFNAEPMVEDMEEQDINDPTYTGIGKQGMPKSNAEMGDDEIEDYYMNLDNVDETIEADGGVEFFKRIAFKK